MAGHDRPGLTVPEGRKFAFTVGTALLVLAGVLWWRGRGTGALILGGTGGALMLAGLVIPGHLGPVYHAWMRLAHLISKVTTPIFMSIVYFFVITPTGLLLALFGKRAMRHVATADGYWVRRDPAEKTDMRRQF